MVEVYRFFAGPSYTEADQAEVQHRWARDGLVIGNDAGTGLAISAPGGMFIRVDTGEFFIRGFWFKNPTVQDFAIANNTSGSTRVDRLVARLSRNSKYARMFISPGTPGLGAPALVQTPDDIYEINLATITVPTGTTANITAGMLAISIPVSLAVVDPVEFAPGVVNHAALAANAVDATNIISGSVSDLLATYEMTATALNGASYGAGYVTLSPTLTFIPSARNRYVLFLANVNIFTLSAGSETAFRLVIDSSVTYNFPGSGASVSGQNTMVGGSCVTVLGPYSNAAHTVRIDMYSSSGFSAAYLRPDVTPSELLHLQVLGLSA